MRLRSYQIFIKNRNMENEQAIAKIYDLVEMFDFDELMADDKEFVLMHLSQEEYERMRSTITDAKELFSEFPSEDIEKKRSNFSKIIGFRIELYKVAAMFLLMIALGYALSKIERKSSDNLIALADTVYVQKTDTIYVEIKDTVEKIREKVVYVHAKEPNNEISYAGNIPETSDMSDDCSKEICPADLVKLNEPKSNNNFSNDKELAGFLVTLN